MAQRLGAVLLICTMLYVALRTAVLGGHPIDWLSTRCSGDADARGTSIILARSVWRLPRRGTVGRVVAARRHASQPHSFPQTDCSQLTSGALRGRMKARTGRGSPFGFRPAPLPRTPAAPV